MDWQWKRPPAWAAFCWRQGIMVLPCRKRHVDPALPHGADSSSMLHKAQACGLIRVQPFGGIGNDMPNRADGCCPAVKIRRLRRSDFQCRMFFPVVRLTRDRWDPDAG